MTRKDERGAVIPAPLQFNNPATASLPRYDDEHRGPAVTDAYELSHCRIDLAERSEAWPIPTNMPPRMVGFAQSIPEDQRSDWLRRQANIEEADAHISTAMQSGELPIWVAPVGEAERLVAPGAMVEVDQATVVSGIYRPPNDRGWLYGRPLFVKWEDWVKFAARIDSAKKLSIKLSKAQTRSHEREDRQWLRIRKAVRILHRILKTRLAGQEPAPWIDPPADPFDADCANATHRHRRAARTSLSLRRAFLAGDLESYLVREGRCLSIPGWAWENAQASENAFNFGWLPIDPFLRDDLHESQDWLCCVHRSEFAAWLKKDGIADIGDLPLVPDAFDLGERPRSITYSEPSKKPFVELTEALTWAAFGLAMSHSVFMVAEEFRYGPFQASNWRDDLGKAMLKLSEQARGGRIRISGRYVSSYSDHAAAIKADTTDLNDNQLRDFACFDSLHGGLQRGKGLVWECQSSEGALNGRADGWRDVEVSRTDLLKYFPARIDDKHALRTPLPATLPGIGEVLGLEEAICWTAHGKPSNDLLMWESAAGDLLFRDRSGTIYQLDDDKEVPEELARDQSRRRAAMLAIWNAMRDGKLFAYVAPIDAQPFAVPRVYWNSVDPECLHLVYRGMMPDNHGAGCPVLLSRLAFNGWRAALAVPPEPVKQVEPRAERKRPGPAPDPDWPHAIAKVTEDCIAAGYKRPLRRGDKAAIQSLLLNFMAGKDKHFSEDIAAKHAQKVIEALPDH